jgi:hypothetical protein
MDELEALLRQFQPRRPRPLPDLEGPRRVRPPTFAPPPLRRGKRVWIAAAGLAAAVAILVARYEPTPVVEAPRPAGVTLGALNAYAMKSAEDLDKALTTISSAILPDVERSGGALHALSKE